MPKNTTKQPIVDAIVTCYSSFHPYAIAVSTIFLLRSAVPLMFSLLPCITIHKYNITKIKIYMERSIIFVKSLNV